LIIAMHGVPPDLDLPGFLGATIERIDLGQFILHFHFAADSPRVIGVEGDWELRAPNGALLDHQMEPAIREAYRLHLLLGKAVTGHIVHAPLSFTLAFESGHTLRIFDRSREYESFSIEPPGIYI